MHYAQCKKFSKPKSRTLTERTLKFQDHQKTDKKIFLDFGLIKKIQRAKIFLDTNRIIN